MTSIIKLASFTEEIINAAHDDSIKISIWTDTN